MTTMVLCPGNAFATAKEGATGWGPGGEDLLATLEKLVAVPVTANGGPKKTLHTRSIRIVDVPVDPQSRMASG